MSLSVQLHIHRPEIANAALIDPALQHLLRYINDTFRTATTNLATQLEFQHSSANLPLPQLIQLLAIVNPVLQALQRALRRTICTNDSRNYCTAKLRSLLQR